MSSGLRAGARDNKPAFGDAIEASLEKRLRVELLLGSVESDRGESPGFQSLNCSRTEAQ